jgi:beta-mannanase
MYRYVVTKLRSLGVTNAVYVWNVMGHDGHAPMYPALYPGHDVVDWIAYDPYGQDGHSTMAALLNRPNANKNWPGFYSWATAKAPGKPIMLGEWGFNLNVNPSGPAALDGGVPILQSQFPMLKALVYWNNSIPGFQVRLGQQSTLGAAYDSAYARFAANAYFNSTSTAAAP